MKLKYKSDFGTIEMLGTENDGFSIYQIEGLELLGRERSLVNFYNSDGYYEASARFGQRVISVSGDIKAKNKSKLEKAVSVLSCPGVLIIEGEDTAREITVNDAVFKLGEKNGAYKKFVAQFTCDISHFTDCDDRIAGVYLREDLITSETALPAVFTERSSVGRVENGGDVKVEPVIVIKCIRAVDGEDGSIIIENHTNGSRLEIEHTLAEGETVTLDIPNRKIESDIAGNLLNSLALGSYLSETYLSCGENEIEVNAMGGNRNIEVYLKYRNLYAGVII